MRKRGYCSQRSLAAMYPSRHTGRYQRGKLGAMNASAASKVLDKMPPETAIDERLGDHVGVARSPAPLSSAVDQGQPTVPSRLDEVLDKLVAMQMDLRPDSLADNEPAHHAAMIAATRGILGSAIEDVRNTILWTLRAPPGTAPGYSFVYRAAAAWLVFMALAVLAIAIWGW